MNRGSTTLPGRWSRRRRRPPTATCPTSSCTRPMEELTQTENAQLATTVLSLVVLDAVERIGLTPAACAGHSLGEYTALVASGALGFDDGIHLVVARGEAMARAGEEAPGTMAALLGIADDDAEAACMRAEGDVWVANYNAPGQVVIAGTAEAVGPGRRAGQGPRRQAGHADPGVGRLPHAADARGPGRPAQGPGRGHLPDARGPVVANVDAHVHDDPAEWPGLLSAQLCSPVRWRQTLETFAGLGLTSLVELGPGGVLSGLAKRSLPEIQSLAVSKPEDLDTLMDQIGAAGTWRAEPALHQGEHLYMSERVVVSPSSGIFTPEASLQAPGTGLLPGTDGGAGPVLGRRRRRPGGPGRRLRGAHALRRPGDPLAGRGRRAGPGGPAPGVAPGARGPLMAVVLVTGGTRGIGAACVEWFLANGDQVATTYRRPTRRRRPPGAEPERFLAVRCDVRNAEEVESAFAAIEEQWGPVEVLVANAGHHPGLADAADERPGLRRRDRHQPDRLVPGGQAGRGQDAAPAHRAASSSSPRSAPSSGCPARPTTPPPRPAWSAWPGPSPARWAAGRSPSTWWPRA